MSAFKIACRALGMGHNRKVVMCELGAIVLHFNINT